MEANTLILGWSVGGNKGGKLLLYSFLAVAACALVAVAVVPMC